MNVLDQAEGNGWAAYHGDCCEVLRSLPSNSIDYSVYSPPFSSLYVYSASERDLGNVRGDHEFFEHFAFLMPEMLRILRPGRNMSCHVMDLPTSKARDGEIGLRDFPGELIRAAQAAGFIWHAKVTKPGVESHLERVTIWKDPVTSMQRTKALGLLHKQLLKDSAMSRMSIPDYVLTFRKPGVNPSPVAHAREDFPVSLWQKWASPYWDDINPSDTLQYRSAREQQDERHIAPLQLEVIRRCVRLWSNPGDTVLTPFGGIGSEAYVAVQEGRRAVLVELKASYFSQAIANLRAAEREKRQPTLFDHVGGDNAGPTS